MIRSIKLFSAVVIGLITTATSCAEAVHFEPGVYETFLLAVNKDGAVTGYFYEELGESRCSFFLDGNAKQETANIVAWGDELYPGELKAGADEFILKVKNAKEVPGCGMVLGPEIDTGNRLSLVTKAPWTELRSIANDKAYFYSEPNADKKLKSYLVKYDVVGVVSSQGEWLQIDYHSPNSGKMSRRWVYSRDTEVFQRGHYY